MTKKLLAPAALAALLVGGGGGAGAAAPRVESEMSEIERVGLIAQGAVSPSPAIRLVTARALRRATSLGSLTAIEHLAADASPLVRLAIAEAAWLRRREAPTRLIGVLERLAMDPEPAVREVALLALGDA